MGYIQSWQLKFKRYVNIYAGNVALIQKWVMHMHKLSVWIHHSEYANHMGIVHASEVVRFFFLSRRV